MVKRSKRSKKKDMSKWYHRFMDAITVVSSWSKDKSTKVAAVIVDDKQRLVSWGFNGFPRGVNDDIEARHERPAKYLWTEHAERNSIYAAAARGIALEGLTMCTNFFPCADCSRSVIQVGLKEIVCERPKNTERDQRWAESFKVSRQMLKEAGVKITYVP
jgi:dCMP deaminase